MSTRTTRRVNRPLTSDKLKQYVRYLSLAVALSGGVLSIADSIKAIPGVPGWMANAWGVFLVLATTIDRLGHAVITHLQKWLDSEVVTVAPEEDDSKPDEKLSFK